MNDTRNKHFNNVKYRQGYKKRQLALHGKTETSYQKSFLQNTVVITGKESFNLIMYHNLQRYRLCNLPCWSHSRTKNRILTFYEQMELFTAADVDIDKKQIIEDNNPI